MTQAHWQPSKNQKLLIDAIHTPTEQAVELWAAWNQNIDFYHDRLDSGTFALLAPLANHLETNIEQLSHGGRLKGIARRAWVEEQLHKKARQAVQTTLSNASVPSWSTCNSFAPLKSGLFLPKSAGLLISAEHAGQAVKILSKSGWKIARGSNQPEGFLVSNGNINIFLRTAPLSTYLTDDRTPQIWKAIRSEPSETQLDSSIQLLQILLDGFTWHPLPNVLWSVDACRVIQSKSIEWSWLLKLADDLSIGYPIAYMLKQLRDLSGLDIPIEYIQPINNSSLSGRWEKISRPNWLRPARIAIQIRKRFIRL